MNNSCLIKDLFIHLKPSTTIKSSFIWTYFCFLYKKPNQSLGSDYIYCKICFDKLRDEQPNSTFSSNRKNIAIYSARSGTGNMKNHLLAAHQIVEPEQTKATNEYILSMFSRDRYSTKAQQLKQQLAHQITLMCCRDLLPFSIVQNEGM